MKCPAYPKYKESGVEWLGQVPGHWEVKRGRFAMMVNPASPVLRALEGDDEVSFLPMDAVGEFGGLRLEQTRAIAEAGGGYTEFQDGDVVLAKITPCFENCKGALATGLVNGAAYGTTELHVLRSGPHLDTRYLFYLTITDGFRKFGEAEMYGAGGQKRVPPEFCKDFPTPLPSSAEQATIADFLDRETGRVDTLVAKKQALIELLKEKRIALISRTVTRGLPAAIAPEFGLKPHTRFKHSGIEWLGEVPEGWEVVKVKFVAKMESGHTPSRSEPSNWIEEECVIPWVSLNDTKHLKENDFIGDTSVKISEKGMKNSSAHLLPAGVVVFTRDATIGLTAITTCPAAVSQHIIAWVPSTKVLPKYLLLSFTAMQQYLESLTFGSTLKTIGMSDVRKLTMPVPPLPEQTAIASYLDRETAKIDRLVAKVEAAIVRLQEYRTALITAAVTGKIDVRQEAL